MRRFLTLSGWLGLIIPIVLLTISELVDIEKSQTIKSIYFFCLEFFWPNSIMLMVFHSNQYDIGTIILLSFIIGINVGLYVFFGWLCWLGATKSKLFLALPPGILIVFYYLAWV